MCFYIAFLHMVCVFTTLFYIWYVFLQRFFRLGQLRKWPAISYHMYFYNVSVRDDSLKYLSLIYCNFEEEKSFLYSPKYKFSLWRVCICCALKMQNIRTVSYEKSRVQLYRTSLHTNTTTTNSITIQQRVVLCKMRGTPTITKERTSTTFKG